MFYFVLVLVFCIAVYIRWNGTYWKRRGVAGPTPLPICGNMLNYLRKKQHYGEVYDDIYWSYPDAPYVGIYKVLNHPAILLRDLELIKDVMTTNFNSFSNNDFVVDPEIDPLISQNPFAAVGEKWKIARSNMAHLFTTMKIKMIFPIITDVCDKLMTHIAKNRENVDASKLCSRYTLEVVASSGFGVQAQTLSMDHSPFQKMTENIYSHGSLIKTTAVLFLPALSKFLKMP